MENGLGWPLNDMTRTCENPSQRIGLYGFFITHQVKTVYGVNPIQLRRRFGVHEFLPRVVRREKLTKLNAAVICVLVLEISPPIPRSFSSGIRCYEIAPKTRKRVQL